MSRPDDPYDTAFAESYWSRLKAEVLENGAFLTLANARIEIGDYIDNYRAGGPVQYRPAALSFRPGRVRLPQPDAIRASN